MERLAINGGSPVRTTPFSVWPVFGEEEELYILDVVRSGKWGGTNRNKLPVFEEKFAAMHGAKHAVSVTNGTIGLTVALQAAGVKPGDEVIMPPYTFIATASAALLFGAIPVFVDVEPDTLLLDLDKVEAAITPRTKAIIAVHIAGAPVNMTGLNEIAAKHGLRVIEDAAQGVGAAWDGRPVGALGDFGSFSFQSGKNVTAGEGGIILTNDEELADIAWSLANVGRIRQGAWYQHERIGWNLRMTEFQAAILLAQLTRYDEQLQRRDRNAKLLTGLISEIGGFRTLKLDSRTTQHAHHLYMFGLTSEAADTIGKADFIRKVNAEGIPLLPGYVSLNRNRAVVAEIEKWTGEKRETSCPVSERFDEREGLWLHQNVLLGTEQDMHDIAQALGKVMNSYG
ncbi:DegT/DnrJ/EryC1/StrS family aminotransferase [Paenibacillus oceani]|uniref:DegT/DnrJ/EryC1/StrS family aminotransferase n=1 Tax=Paenibacillus oceani TaxID=2772510 RepID=A0A927GXX1_9BACL|nr:DegT/DnrJ/EryC1/StrS family aminotransferase [Paenibacillus oceani]MBD2861286.1 DegT/DnrJ/EryC1/StrS family aminotransferase [Paenibacillus oceani]